MDNLRQRVTLSDVLSDGGIEMTSGLTYNNIKKLYLPIIPSGGYSRTPAISMSFDITDKYGNILREGDSVSRNLNGMIQYSYMDFNFTDPESSGFYNNCSGNLNSYSKDGRSIHYYILRMGEYYLLYTTIPLLNQSSDDSYLYPYIIDNNQYVCVDFSIFSDIFSLFDITYFYTRQLQNYLGEEYKCYYVPA